MNRTRLLLLDDHILFREGLSRLLASEPDFEVVGSCGTSAEAIEVLEQTSVDIVLLDFDLGEDHASQFISFVRRRSFDGKILMVTAGMNANESSNAIRLGASGIFLKQNSPATLTKAIRMIAAGEAWVDEKVMRLLAAAVDENEVQSYAKILTVREHQVLQGVFEGLTNKEIATQLKATESAVKATLQQLFHKTGVRTRSQLVRIALERSLGHSGKSSS
jgi:two-component system, NarL family, nitrate/nitrite response regulator NarL